MLLNSALYIGGAERVIASLAKYLDRSRFNVTVCHLRECGHIGEELKRAGFDVVGIERDERGWRRYLSFRRLAKVIQERRIDLIHTHTHYALADAALCRGIAGVRARLVHTFHFGNYPYMPRRYWLMECFAARASDRLIAVGNEQRQRIADTYRLHQNRIGVVMNGVEPGSGAVDQEWRNRLTAANAIVIGTICTFIEQKGLPDLVRVAHTLTRTSANVIFVVVGDGPLRTSIEAQCRTLGIADRVYFTGWKEAAASTMMPLFDVFFQPSLWEAMSMVVLEAMAAGKPVVATDVGDNRHVLLDGQTGFIVPRGDIGAMTRALRTLIESAELRQRLGAAGRARFAERYTVEAMTRRYENVYVDALSDVGA